MKTYLEIVEERYNTREANIHIYDNQYSFINPVGFYGKIRLQTLFYVIFNKLREMQIDISKLKILDVGCGTGWWTRFFAEMLNSPLNIYGIDLSVVRVQMASKINPRMHYSIGDITNFRCAEGKFDLISAIDVFMFFNTEEQIMNALRNINSYLNENGVFIWYDTYSKDHFSSKTNQEGAGYSPRQIEGYAEKSGFKKLFMFPIFKNLLWRYHSMYLVKRFPFWLVILMENILPGSHGNLCYVFRKINNVK
jgi:SAM-dependent methyltransferase